MIKNVIFDLGGVLVGRDFANFGRVVAKCFTFFAGERFPQCWHDFDRGTKSREEVVRELAAMNGMSEQEVSEAVDDLVDKMRVIPETVDLIKELKTLGYHIYILSNMPTEYYQKLKRLDFFNLVDGTVISSQERLIKPDPRFYNVLLERYNLKANECLFVDDKPGNIEAARDLGIRGVVYDNVEKGVELIKRILYDDKRNC